MYVKTLILLLLLLFTACLMEAEEALEFPNYTQASVTLPEEIQVQPVFSSANNYCVVAVSDTLCHLELRHGRIHGKTGLPGTIMGLAVGTDGSYFAATESELCLVEGFQLAKTVDLSSSCIEITTCGANLLLLMEDGRLQLRNSQDLTLIGEYDPPLDDVLFIQGFNGIAVLASTGGIVKSYSIPEFKLVAETVHQGEILFLEAAGSEMLLLSTDAWNEIAVCSPEDLQLDVMFTFQVAPVESAADSSLSFIYGVCPGHGVQVCRQSGEIAWRSSSYGYDSKVVLSGDNETAVITSGNRLDILTR